MGKATIIENLGAGKYKVRVEQDMSRIDARDDKILAALAGIANDELPAAESTYTDAVSAHESASSQLSTLLAELKLLSNPAEIQAKRAEIRDQTGEVLRSQANRDAAARDLASVRLKKLSIEKERSRLETIKTSVSDDIRETWAVDYTDDLAVGTEVGTSEINGEVKKAATREYIKVAPGGGLTSGISTSGAALDPQQHYVAVASKPGWQRWKPTYRVGVITNIDYDSDKCDLSLEYAASEETKVPAKTDPRTGKITPADNFNINQTDTLSDVDIEYMTCNAGAFELGDRVMVKFENQDWTKPVVIGFETDPLPCSNVFCFGRDMSGRLGLGNDYEIEEYAWGPVAKFTKTALSLTETVRVAGGGTPVQQ